MSDSVSGEWRLAGWLLGLSVAGAVVYATLPNWPNWLGVPVWLYEVGRAVAFTISTGLGVGAVIEIFATRQLLNVASDEVAARVLGVHLPGEFQDRLRSLIRGVQLVREDWTADYSIERMENEMVKVTLEQRYRVRNYGTRKEPYQPQNSEDHIYQPKFTLLEVTHRNKQVKLDWKSYIDPATMATKVDGPKLRLAGRDDAASSWCDVHWRLELIAPKSYTHVLAFGGPTLNPRVSVSRSEGFEFEAGKNAVATPTTWQFQRAYLDGEHLRVWWRPKVT